MSLRTAINRTKAIAYIYRYLGRNVKKIPRWLAGKGTPAEDEEFNKLQRDLQRKFGLSIREVRAVAKDAAKKAK